MSKAQRIIFSFDERSYESLDKMIEQGRYPGNSSTDRADYQEIEVTNPENGETRIIVLPKDTKDKCRFCGK